MLRTGLSAAPTLLGSAKQSDAGNRRDTVTGVQWAVGGYITVAFDSLLWAGSILSCGREQARERMKAAIPDDLSIGREELGVGGMGKLRRLASEGNRDAIRTCREIEFAFAACERARDTGAPCTTCGPVVTVYSAAA